uniref:Si:dkey-201c13.2 n=1 Tax=Fundulus heteroclitus TaxID=8078 RepID=A0A3Q2NUE0_FUNHE
LLDLTGCGGRSLAAHAGGVDCLRGDQIQVLVIWDLIEPVPVLQELDVQVLV